MSSADRHVLVVFGAAAFLLVQFCLTTFFAAPGLRGGVTWLWAIIGLVVLLAGPLVLGGRDRLPLLFLVYGCVGGFLFVQLFIPTPRQAWAQAMARGLPTRAEDISFIAGSVAGVLFIGLTCRLLAVGRYKYWPARGRCPKGHCRSCGYDLTGNESGVCPECGTRIGVIRDSHWDSHLFL